MLRRRRPTIYLATRGYVDQKLIIPKRVPTHDNIADCLTKALELASWNNVGMRMKGYAPIPNMALQQTLAVARNRYGCRERGCIELGMSTVARSSAN